VALLLITYLIAAQIGRKRFAGLVAVIVLMQSPIFLRYDSSTPYNYIWVMFYLLSVYLIRRKWQVSIAAYIASFFSKSLAGAFLPLSLFAIYDSRLPAKKKGVAAIPYVAAIVAFLSSVALGITLTGVDFSVEKLWTGLNSIPILLQPEGLFLTLVLPITLGLYMLARKNVSGALSVMLLMGGMVWASGFLTAITDTANLDYRIILIIVFFAIGTGLMFSRTYNSQVGNTNKIARYAVLAICLPVVLLIISTFFFPALYSEQNFR
jgi:hypothetical protein